MPAHAHADLLTWEASVNGQRLFVDAGVFNYQDDVMRRYCRSTAAHNVLQIDDYDQFDLWSRFRMGYRGWTHGLRTGESGGFQWAEAWHDAYRRLGIPQVYRRVAYQRGGPWIVTDRALGSGTHRLTNRLHIHPEWHVEQSTANEFTLRCGATELLLRALGEGQTSLADGWYCPEFGSRQRCCVAQWTAKTKLPSACGWYLIRPGTEDEIISWILENWKRGSW